MIGFQHHKPELATFVVHPQDILTLGTRVIAQKIGVPAAFGLTHTVTGEDEVIIGAFLLNADAYNDDQMSKLVAFGIQADGEFKNFEVLLLHTFGVDEYDAGLDETQLSYVTLYVPYEDYQQFQDKEAHARLLFSKP